jgi:hypothetical protein
MNVIPKVKGTNRKWYIAVKANCSLDRSITSNMTFRSRIEQRQALKEGLQY